MMKTKIKSKGSRKKEKREIKKEKHSFKTRIIKLKEIPQLDNPILIEGLPGIGFVGKFAAEALIDDLKAEKIAELYSHRFPHQVLFNKDGTIKMLNNEIYLYKRKKNDLLILVGDVQPTSPEAQHEVMNIILDFFEELGGKTIYTLGGYSVGKILSHPRVLGSVTDKEMINSLKKYGVVFGITEGSIVGAAGLLLGLGKLRGMKGACLMGETHGSYIDHRAAKEVLEVLSKILDIHIDVTKLEKKAKESEEIIKKIEEETKKAEAPISGIPISPKKPDELTYIR